MHIQFRLQENNVPLFLRMFHLKTIYTKLFFCQLSFEYIRLSVISRGVVSTGPLAHGHLIWPLGHLLLDSTGPDWPPMFKA